jgi:UPF0755 protein
VTERQDILPPGYAQNEPRSGPEHRKRRHRQRDEEHPGRRKHPILLVLLIVFALLLAVAIGGVVWVEGQINPSGHHGPDVPVSIPAGASTSQIGSILARAGVIHNGSLFALYVRIHGDGPLYPGSYSLPKNSSYSSAISALKAGPKLVTEKLIVPEGFTLRQIAAAVGALPQLHLSAQRFLAAATNGEVRSPYEPRGVSNLEGLLFPATYQVRQGESEIDVLEQMVGAFDDQATSVGLTAAAARIHLTPYQVVTVASIVEREAKLYGDRGPVASALYNRLRIGMPLGADSTQTYYLRLHNPQLTPTASQLNQPSPYNTRVVKGLPPTPIANPGLASLQAATNPPHTTYVYFVEVKPSGQLGFASTTAGFDQLQQQCRAAKLC